LPVLIGWRAVQAVGAAVLLPTTLGLALPAFAPHQRGTVRGIWAAVGAVAGGSGPVLGYGVESAVPQQRRERWKINPLNKSTRCVMTKPLRMDMGDIGAPSKNGEQIAESRCASRSRLSSIG
jgi:hypothetical protein